MDETDCPRIGPNGNKCPQNEAFPCLQMEYSAIRNEILKRIELRQSIIQMTLTLAAAFLSVGLIQIPSIINSVTQFSVVLIYPPIALGLAGGWYHLDKRIRDSVTYIRRYIEPTFPCLDWEKHKQKQRDDEMKGKNSRLGLGRLGRQVVLSHGIVFVGTQIMALVIGSIPLIKAKQETNQDVVLIDIYIVLIIVSCISILIVLVILNKAKHWEADPPKTFPE